GVTLKSDVDNAKTIGDLIDHPALFANYPQLRDVPVRWKDWGPDWKKGDRAGISAEGRLLINSNLPDSQLITVVLHEMQHLVQAFEGFARGGSPTSSEVVEAAAQAGGTPEALFEMYQNLAGEIEARDVQARMLMSDEERAANAPYTSEGLSREPILRFGDGPAASVSTPPTGDARQVLDALRQPSSGFGPYRFFKQARALLPDMSKAQFDEAVIELRKQFGDGIMLPTDSSMRAHSAEEQKNYVEDKGNVSRWGWPLVYTGVNLDNLPGGDIRFSRAGTPGVGDIADQIGSLYNTSAPIQRAMRKLAAFGAKTSAGRSLRLWLDRRITTPYHIAMSGRSAGFTNLFQGVLRPTQQFTDYLMSSMLEP
ncbi:MAG: hypothetical protein ACREX8_17005, partial [Gammaproteobacteria bacterium]